MSDITSDLSAVTEAKGGSDAARISEVKSWLTSQFEAAGKEVPNFEYTHRSITHLYNLATVSQAKSQAATIVANDFRLKASEYRAQGTNLLCAIVVSGLRYLYDFKQSWVFGKLPSFATSTLISWWKFC